MKRKFTKLAAAFALLAALCVPLGMWGQTRVTQTVSYGWETNDDASNWTITDITRTQGTGNTGEYFGYINKNNTYVQFKQKVYVTSFSFAFKRTSGNNNYNVYIETSTDGSNWTAVETYAMSSFPNGSYETKTKTFDGTQEYYVRFHCYNTTAVRHVDDVSITYQTNASNVAAPTFTPASGTTFGNEGLDVTLTCATEGSTIYYTLDNSNPTNASTLYQTAIHLTETTTVKAIAYVNSDASSVATATYTYVDPNAPGTQNNPYTVAQARAAIDAGTGTQSVYATGIVSAIPTAWSTQYNNITFNFVDEEGDTEFLQAFRCVSGTGVDASEVAVGDIVVVYGNMSLYNSVYQFNSSCQLVSLTHPAVAVEAPTFNPEEGIYDEAQNVTIACATDGATIYYTTDGTQPTSSSTPYTIPINVATTTTIKAIAVKGEDISTVATATYTIAPIVNISSIAEVGTAYTVRGTVVATNSRGFIMGDGTGYVYYYRNDAVSQSIGDKVKVSGTTSTYGQIIQFNNTATVTEVTTSNYNNTPAATLITEVPNYTQGYHLSTYFEFEGELTKSGSNYFIALGESQIQISYPTTEQGTALTALDGKNVHVKGYFSGINSNSKFTVMLESATEVLVPSITLNSYLIEATAEETEGSLTVTYTEIATSLGASIYWFESDGVTAASEPDWMSAEINTDLNVEYLIEENEGEARTAYFKVYGVDANLNDVYSDLVTVTQEAAPPVAYYDYSINGVVGGDINEAVVGTPVTLANGEDLNANFTFAGWSTDPDDVETLYTQYTFNADEVVTFYAVYAHTTGGATAKEGEASYVKVTSTDDIEDGNYLIVAVGTYADENPYQVAFNGSLNPFDAVGNVINVTINDDEIAATTETNAAAFTIASVTGGYSIQGTSGKYIGVSSYSNGLTTNDAAIVNGIDFENNNVLITVGTTGGTMTLKFNKASNQNRFRYYKSGQEPIQLYKYTDGGTPTPQPTTAYYTRVFLADPTTPVDIVGPSIVPSGVTLNMGSNSLTNSKGASKFVIEDGAQLKTPSAVYATVEKNITGYGEANAQTNKGYYLVSAPAEKYLYVDLNNADVDAYRFDASQEQEEWQNFKLAQGAWHIAANSAVLYASKEDCTLSLDGYGIVYNHPNPGANIVYNKVPATTSNVNVDVVFNSGKVFEGFNLIGNPFTCTAYLADGRDFYRMNAAGDAIVLADDNNGGDAINVCEGIFVVCTANGTVTFTTTDPSDASAGNNNGMVNISVAQVVNSRGAQPSADYARIRINNGENLTKFVFNENTSRIYIPQAGKDYAVVRSAAEGEMPVSFKASKNGTYTLNIEAENVEMNYLHLIDNLTGMDVDLLQTPSYTFDAKTSDYASRFRLVFKANGTNENNAETFAYFNGTNWTVSNVGDATLQVVDVTGRTVANQMINGNAELNLNQPAGVYVIRLVNGDNVKTQKVVVR